MSQTKQWTIERTVEALDSVRVETGAFLRSHGVYEHVIARTELAVYEALINVVEHGKEEFRNRPMELVCRIDGDSLFFELKSEGEFFDINNAPMPEPTTHFKSGKDGGLGVYIIRTFMDDVEYRHEDGVNYLSMKMKLPGVEL